MYKYYRMGGVNYSNCMFRNGWGYIVTVCSEMGGVNK